MRDSCRQLVPFTNDVNTYLGFVDTVTMISALYDEVCTSLPATITYWDDVCRGFGVRAMNLLARILRHHIRYFNDPFYGNRVPNVLLEYDFNAFYAVGLPYGITLGYYDGDYHRIATRQELLPFAGRYHDTSTGEIKMGKVVEFLLCLAKGDGWRSSADYADVWIYQSGFFTIYPCSRYPINQTHLDLTDCVFNYDLVGGVSFGTPFATFMGLLQDKKIAHACAQVLNGAGRNTAFLRFAVSVASYSIRQSSCWLRNYILNNINTYAFYQDELSSVLTFTNTTGMRQFEQRQPIHYAGLFLRTLCTDLGIANAVDWEKILPVGGITGPSPYNTVSSFPA